MSLYNYHHFFFLSVPSPVFLLFSAFKLWRSPLVGVYFTCISFRAQGELKRELFSHCKGFGAANSFTIFLKQWTDSTLSNYVIQFSWYFYWILFSEKFSITVYPVLCNGCKFSLRFALECCYRSTVTPTFIDWLRGKDICLFFSDQFSLRRSQRTVVTSVTNIMKWFADTGKPPSPLCLVMSHLTLFEPFPQIMSCHVYFRRTKASDMSQYCIEMI